MIFHVLLELGGEYLAYNRRTIEDVARVQLRQFLRSALTEKRLVRVPEIAIDYETIIVEAIPMHIDDEAEDGVQAAIDELNLVKMRLDIAVRNPPNPIPEGIIENVRLQLMLLLSAGIIPLPGVTLNRVEVIPVEN